MWNVRRHSVLRCSCFVEHFLDDRVVSNLENNFAAFEGQCPFSPAVITKKGFKVKVRLKGLKYEPHKCSFCYFEECSFAVSKWHGSLRREESLRGLEDKVHECSFCYFEKCVYQLSKLHGSIWRKESLKCLRIGLRQRIFHWSRIETSFSWKH